VFPKKPLKNRHSGGLAPLLRVRVLWGETALSALSRFSLFSLPFIV
jgi:hypothetical protein